MRRKIAVYLEEQEYINLQRITNRENKTITAYCKEKIFEQPNKNVEKEDLLKNHILRQFEDLLYLLISQYDLKKTIDENTIKKISSYATYVGNLKAIHNKKLKLQKTIYQDYKPLFKLVNISTINSLVSKVNDEKEPKQKIFLLASFINQIRNILKDSNEKI